MGETEMSAADFMEVLSESKENFTAAKYHIFENNCNHFANFCTEVLVGRPIPDKFLNQAKEFQDTPIGKMLSGFHVNANNNNDNYNISYQGFQNANNQRGTARLSWAFVNVSPRAPAEREPGVQRLRPFPDQSHCPQKHQRLGNHESAALPPGDPGQCPGGRRLLRQLVRSLQNDCPLLQSAGRKVPRKG